jgi:gas vesicle protein
VSRVFGDPARLEAYTAEVTVGVHETRHAVEDYRAAVAAFNAAGPNDLGTQLADLGQVIDPDLELLLELDQAPAAFGFALRHLDAFDVGGLTGMRVTDLDRFEALATARLQHPDAAPDDVVGLAYAALDTGWVLPWDDDEAWPADPASAVWWTGTAIGAASAGVKAVWERYGVDVRGHYRGERWIDAHGRWRPGWAQRINGELGRATTWRRAGQHLSRASAVLVVVPGIEQALEDRNDPSLTAGQRIARVGSRTALEGGGGFLGGLGGMKAGAAAGFAAGSVVPGVGNVVGVLVGGALGGVAGGIAGAEAGKFLHDNFQGAVQWSGDRIDDAIELGASAVDTVTDVGASAWDGAREVGGNLVDGAADLGSSALDTVTDVGGTVSDTVGGWFGR